MSKPTIAFIGAGRAANVLGVALTKAGYDVVAVASRSEASAEKAAEAMREAGALGCRFTSVQGAANAGELVLITTTDAAIAAVASSVTWRAGQGVVHCSGALGADVLSAAARQGARVGSWHPFQTLAGTASLEGVAFGIEAEPQVYGMLAEMAEAVGAEPLHVPAEARALYHASSVLACGYLTTLLREARRVWQAAGLPEEAGRRAIGAIAASTVQNVRRLSEEATVTGPVSRGDISTVRLHLDRIAEAEPELLPLYTAISRRSAVLALDADRPTRSLDEWDALYEAFLPVKHEMRDLED